MKTFKEWRFENKVITVKPFGSIGILNAYASGSYPYHRHYVNRFRSKMLTFSSWYVAYCIERDYP